MSKQEETATIETFAPDEAQRLLEKSPGNPRYGHNGKLYHDAHVLRLARDMTAGIFYPTSTIHLGKDGEPLNGHHRLAAVVLSGIPQRFVVVRNTRPEAIPTIDADHIPRSLSHSANAVGMDWLAGKTAAMVSQMYSGVTRPFSDRLTRQEALDFAIKHREALEFSAGLFKTHTRGISTSPVKAAVARAWYHIPEKTLTRFVEVLYTGVSNGEEDVGAIRLRDLLLRSGGGLASGTMNRDEAYRKTCRAIKAFADRQAIANLRAITQEIFPLPGELNAS